MIVEQNVPIGIGNVSFLDELILADVAPVFKKNNRDDKEKYRPATILPALPKNFKACSYDQIFKKVYSILSKYQTDY